VGPSGAILWRAGLQGAPVGAVLYATNPTTPTRPLVVVADRFPEVAAFDAATGARVWQVVPAASPAPFDASPALSPDGRTLYAANDAGALTALDVATGGPAAGFGVGGRVALPAGTQSSPVVDAAGTLYLGTNDGALVALAPDGRTLWTLPGGLATGASGSGSAKDMSPAIGADGTLYAGGNGGAVRGFRVGGSLPTATPGPAGATATPSATATATSTPSAAPSATATSTSTDLPTPSGPTPTFPPGPPPGTDLSHLNTANAHYIAASNGLTELRLYNAPVGLPDATGWHLRDPGLRPAVPFVASPSPIASVSPASPVTATSVAASPVPRGTSRPLARQRAGAGLAIPTLTVPTPGVPATTVALTDTSVVTATGPLTPAALPFDLHLAPTANSPALASLTNEDGVSLTLGLAAINGVAPAPVPGVVGASGDAITYTAPVASAPATLALHPTVSGLDLRLVLHSAAEAGPILVRLSPNAGTRVVQEGDGDIRVTQAITTYGDNGTPLVTQQPEYFVEPASAIDSGQSRAALVSTGPVSVAVASAPPSGAQTLTLIVDPVWLRDPHRVYPVRIDLPLVTAYSAVHSGLFGTVTACAPGVSAPPTGLAVGVDGSCAYHGHAYFDLTTLPYDTPIVSATLRLYTPDQTGPTGVRVYPNAAPALGPLGYRPAPWLPPSQDTAPAVLTGTAPLAQSDSEGHWQGWDVTAAVQQWVRDARANGGLTLTLEGAVLRVASSLGASGDAPDTAPYLDIVYGPRAGAASGPTPHLSPHSRAQRVAPRLSADPGVYGIWGVSGSIAANCPNIPCSNDIGVDTVRNLGGYYVRIGVTLQCYRGQPSAVWWTSHAPGSSKATASFDYPSSAYDIMRSAYAQGVIPIVTFRTNAQCPSWLIPSRWRAEVRAFLSGANMPSDVHGQLGSHLTYYEIANEINGDGTYSYGIGSMGGSYRYYYAGIYASAAQGVQDAYNNQDAPYRILTSGMELPTAYATNCYGCTNPPCALNEDIAANGLNAAQYLIRNWPAHLGSAVHPYRYNTANGWRNYYGSPNNNRYAGMCYDLGTMVSLWTSSVFSGLPLVFTEDNWTDHPCRAGEALQGGGVCTTTCQSSVVACEGAYLVDLGTWLADNQKGDYHTSPLRIAWFNGTDFHADPGDPAFPTNGIATFGLYTATGQDKIFTINPATCPLNGAISGTHAVASEYMLVALGGYCY